MGKDLKEKPGMFDVISMWLRRKKDVKQDNAERAYKLLKNQTSTQVMLAEENVLKAEQKIEEAIMEAFSIQTSDLVSGGRQSKKLMDCEEELEVAQKRLEIAKRVESKYFSN